MSIKEQLEQRHTKIKCQREDVSIIRKHPYVLSYSVGLVEEKYITVEIEYGKRVASNI